MGDENPILSLVDYFRPIHEAIGTPLSSPMGIMWCLFDQTPSGWCKTDAYSMDFGRTTKLWNDILMFQEHQGESLSEAWTHFKDLLQNVPHYGIDLWLQVQIFYDHVNPATRRTIDHLADGRLHEKRQRILDTILRPSPL
nr:zinc finger, CCHC-type [Tanacetum cinerariifolium]